MILADYSKYEGHFDRNSFHGFGVLETAAQIKYEGQFANGEPMGFGQLTFADGTSGRPSLMGEWRGFECVRRFDASAAVKEARSAAAFARNLVLES